MDRQRGLAGPALLAADQHDHTISPDMMGCRAISCGMAGAVGNPFVGNDGRRFGQSVALGTQAYSI
jgi:hypothetical protein